MPTGPGGSTMMPGETHSAAPATAADLSRCQGCASLQQVRRLPGAEGAGCVSGALRLRGGSCPEALLPLPFSNVLGTFCFALFTPATQDSLTGLVGGGGGVRVCRAYPASGLPRAGFGG